MFYIFPYSMQHFSVRLLCCLLVTWLQISAERAAHLTLTPGDKNLRFQNLWNTMAIHEIPRVQSIPQSTLCGVSMDVCLETQQCVVWLESRVTVDAILWTWCQVILINHREVLRCGSPQDAKSVGRSGLPIGTAVWRRELTDQLEAFLHIVSAISSHSGLYSFTVSY